MAGGVVSHISQASIDWQETAKALEHAELIEKSKAEKELVLYTQHNSSAKEFAFQNDVISSQSKCEKLVLFRSCY